MQYVTKTQHSPLIKPNKYTRNFVLGLSAITLIIAFSGKARAAEAKLQGSKVYLINQSVGTKVDAVISLARDNAAIVYECNKMKLSKKATLTRDNKED